MTSCQQCPLRKLRAVTPVSRAELDFIESLRLDQIDVAAGRAIISEGHRDSRLFTLFSGWAFRYKTLRDGRRQILNFLMPGDFIGLQQNMAIASPHGVEALSDVRLCSFPRDGLWQLHQHFPSLGHDVTWLAAHEELIVDENLLSVGQRSAAERIAMLLMHLYKRASALFEIDAAGIPFPITQQHIADALGLSLVHTNKTLRKLERAGLHEISKGRLRLLNVQALQRLADYYGDGSAPARPVI